MVRRVSFLFLSLAAIVLSAVWFFRFAPLAISGTNTLKHPTCSHAMASAVQTHTSWRGSELVLEVEQPKNCAYSLAGTTTQRIGSRLFVRAAYAYPEGAATGCNCGHKFTVVIPDLPQQAYAVSVYSWP